MDKQPGRIHPNKGDLGNLPMSEPEFPQLTKMKAFDRHQHIQKAIEMGMSREEAERHAEHDLADRDETERTPPTEGPTS